MIKLNITRSANGARSADMEIEGTLKDLIVDMCVGINAVYDSILEDAAEDGLLFRTSIAAIAGNPDSPLWDTPHKMEVAE